MNNIQHNPDLTRWAKQGVLLLNTSLTVRKGYPNSHIIIRGKKLWQRFTSKIITYLSRRDQFTVFILWGNKAKDYKLRDNPPINPFDNIRVIESSHPSPLGAYHSFWGSKPFSKANKFLEEQDIEPIEWIN